MSAAHVCPECQHLQESLDFMREAFAKLLDKFPVPPDPARGAAERQDLPTPDSRQVFPNIVEDARRLGVSRMHLWAVLSGRRESSGLVRRYSAMKERRQAPRTAAATSRTTAATKEA